MKTFSCFEYKYFNEQRAFCKFCFYQTQDTFGLNISLYEECRGTEGSSTTSSNITCVTPRESLNFWTHPYSYIYMYIYTHIYMYKIQFRYSHFSCRYLYSVVQLHTIHRIRRCSNLHEFSLSDDNFGQILTCELKLECHWEHQNKMVVVRGSLWRPGPQFPVFFPNVYLSSS